MTSKLEVQPQGVLGRWFDHRLENFMRYLSGASSEEPQRTHFWNNHHLKEEDVEHLNSEWMVSHPGDKKANSFPRIPLLSGALAHSTKYGGWKRYLVIEPTEELSPWYIGWRWPGGAGVSRVLTSGSKRVTVGPGPTEWFGINSETSLQIQIKKVGEGYIGDGSSFAQVPMF